jgi:hypothetical protein
MAVSFDKFMRPFVRWSGKVMSVLKKKSPNIEFTMQQLTRCYSQGMTPSQAAKTLMDINPSDGDSDEVRHIKEGIEAFRK